MRTRGTVRALGVAPIVVACAVLCGVPTVAIALTGTTSQKTAPAVGASGGAVKRAHRRPKQVIVVSRFAVQPLELSVQAGHFTTLFGKLLPASPGRVVSLIGRAGGRWSKLASARTGRAGGFSLRSAARAGSTSLRVSFAGDHGARATAASAGTVVGLEPTVASWYYDAGSTACGFHAYYGVANKTLPCGTHVTFEYGGHSVIATVDDRGPYVYGRSFDFNQNVSRVLGMYGVASVLASVQ